MSVVSQPMGIPVPESSSPLLQLLLLLLLAALAAALATACSIALSAKFVRQPVKGGFVMVVQPPPSSSTGTSTPHAYGLDAEFAENPAPTMPRDTGLYGLMADVQRAEESEEHRKSIPESRSSRLAVALLSAGDQHKQTVFHRSALMNPQSSASVIRKIIATVPRRDRPFLLNARDHCGQTPLHIAVKVAIRYGDPAAVRTLVELGADPSVQDDSGRNAVSVIPRDGRIINAGGVMKALLRVR